MKNIPPLYHWSPRQNRLAILERGLKATTPSGRHGLAVCLGVDPLIAWALSGGMRDGVSVEWDLFQVHVSDTPVHRVRHWDRLVEYRIPRDIRPSGVVLIASKTIGKDLA